MFLENGWTGSISNTLDVRKGRSAHRMKEKEGFLKNIPFITFEVNNRQIDINLYYVYVWIMLMVLGTKQLYTHARV